TAFNVKKLPPPRGVGMIQPFGGGQIGKAWSMLFLALIALAIFIGITRPRHQVFNETIQFDDVITPAWGSDDNASAPQPQPSNSNERSRVIFTKPFALTGGNNLMVDGYS